MVATTGPVICDIASSVASATSIRGFSSRLRVTFSTTTIASSTTSVIASTIANSDTVFALYPAPYSTANTPIRLTGMAKVGMRVARQSCRNRNVTPTTSAKVIASVRAISPIVAVTNFVAL